MSAHRLWAGTALGGTATALQVLTSGGWGVALIAVLGLMLLATSFANKGARR